MLELMLGILLLVVAGGEVMSSWREAAASKRRASKSLVMRDGWRTVVPLVDSSTEVLVVFCGKVWLWGLLASLASDDKSVPGAMMMN